MKTIIELTEQELVCLLFWYASFKTNTIVKPLDTEFFERLNRLYHNIDKVNVYSSMFTPLPKYQPGQVPEGDKEGCPPIFFG